jgi:hypothetical protein
MPAYVSETPSKVENRGRLMMVWRPDDLRRVVGERDGHQHARFEEAEAVGYVG